MSRIRRFARFLPILLLLSTQALSGCAISLFGSGDEASEQPSGIVASDPINAELAQSFSDRITGKNLAANIPYAESLPWVGAPKPNEKLAREHFADGERKLFDKQFGAARASYEQAALHLPDSPLHEDAMFRIAETLFFEDEYPEAFKAYEELIEKYKRSRHLDTIVLRQFAIGKYWQEENQEDPENFLTPNLLDKTRPFNDTRGNAMRAFEKVRLNHPTGDLADDSLMATAGSMFLRRRYEDADYHYTLLRREYPDSEHQYQAHVLGIQAKIRSYQGPDYDGTVLGEAKELIQQTLKQFPQISQDDRQRLNELYAQVITNLAARDFQMALFYDRKEYFGAAKIYYERVTRDFPHTSVATEARERIAELDGKPNEPPARFTWISSLFPDDKKDVLKLDGVASSDTIRR